jgi:acetyl esterase/lipase
MSRLHANAGPLTWGSEAYPAPRPHRSETGELIYDSLVYAVHEGYRPLFLDLRLPPAQTGPTPVVVWIHGGGWVHGSRRRQSPNIDDHHVLDTITSAGYAVAVIDYRLILEAAFPAALLDVRAAVDWLHDHADHFGLDRDRIALWGESAGAHLAMMAAWCNDAELVGADARPQVASVVEWYGPSRMIGHSAFADDRSGETTGYATNPMDILITGSGWTPEQLSPLMWAQAATSPVFIAHGREDELSVTDSIELHAALLGHGVDAELLVVDGGHVFVGADTIDEVVARSIAFLDRVMPAHAPTEDVSTDLTEWAPTTHPALRVTELEIEGPHRAIPLRITEPEIACGGIVLYIGGSGRTDAYGEQITETTSSVVVEIDCQLASDHPGTTDDVMAAVRWAREHADELRADPAQLVLAGYGAGGAVAISAALECTTEAIPAQALFLLNSVTDPVISGRLASLPSTIMATGQLDPLLGDNHRFARRLREEGVRVVHRIESQIRHDHLGAASDFSGDQSISTTAIGELDHFLRRSRSRYGEPTLEKARVG